eukprot:352986-Chlamydomonas_euryale.AAC.22
MALRRAPAPALAVAGQRCADSVATGYRCPAPPSPRCAWASAGQRTSHSKQLVAAAKSCSEIGFSIGV